MGKNLIIGMTFPKQDKNLGLEPSLLTVFPEGDNVIYSMENDHSYNDEDVLYYMCSVYITGMYEFFEWSTHHDKKKIICGGYEPTINPESFLTRLNCMAENTNREFFRDKKAYLLATSFCSGTKTCVHTMMGACEMLGFTIEGRSTREYICLWKDEKLR